MEKTTRLPTTRTATDPRRLRARRRTIGWVLAVLFIVALLMGPGPGMLLINVPQSFLGVPALYAWGLLWYAVEVAVVVAAYCFVWPDE